MIKNKMAANPRIKNAKNSDAVTLLAHIKSPRKTALNRLSADAPAHNPEALKDDDIPATLSRL
jgi:hypothetical protein